MQNTADRAGVARAGKGNRTAPAAAGALILTAAAILAHTYWPARKAGPKQAYYTTDDGATWFRGTAFEVAPFDHDGRPAAIAEVYTYDDGRRAFCGYLARFTPAAKARLERAIADAKARGQPPTAVTLYQDRGFMRHGMEVRRPGPNQPWVPYDDPRANDVFAVRAPDGSTIDQLFVY